MSTSVFKDLHYKVTRDVQCKEHMHVQRVRYMIILQYLGDIKTESQQLCFINYKNVLM